MNLWIGGRRKIPISSQRVTSFSLLADFKCHKFHFDMFCFILFAFRCFCRRSPTAKFLRVSKDEPSHAGWLEENFHINFMSRWVRQMQALRENKPSEIFFLLAVKFPPSISVSPKEFNEQTVCLPDRTFMIIPFLIIRKPKELEWKFLYREKFSGANKDPRMGTSFAGRLTRSKNIERKDWVSRTISNWLEHSLSTEENCVCWIFTSLGMKIYFHSFGAFSFLPR